MLYRVVVTFFILLLQAQGFASGVLHFNRQLGVALNKARLPYVEKLAQSMQIGEDLRHTVITKIKDLASDTYIDMTMGMLEEIEAIKVRATAEANDLDIFAVKFYLMLDRNKEIIDIASIPYFRFVDRHKHLLSNSDIKHIDMLAADIKKITSRDWFIDDLDEDMMRSVSVHIDSYTDAVYRGLRRAGAVDLPALVEARGEALVAAMKKIMDVDELLLPTLMTPFVELDQLKTLRIYDIQGAEGTDEFRIDATKHGFTAAEIESLAHLFDLAIGTHSLVIDYLADKITSREYAVKMEDLLDKHKGTLDDATGEELRSQTAEID